jgi:hypothetical protein
VFEGALSPKVRSTKTVSKYVSLHRQSAQTLLKSVGENEVIPILKSLLERQVFESEQKAKLAFTHLFSTPVAQAVQRNDLEADAARSEAKALFELVSQTCDQGDLCIKGADS